MDHTCAKGFEVMTIKVTLSDKDYEPKADKSRASHHGRLNPALEDKSLNQFLDDLYIEDYLEKERR